MRDWTYPTATQLQGGSKLNPVRDVRLLAIPKLNFPGPTKYLAGMTRCSARGRFGPALIFSMSALRQGVKESLKSGLVEAMRG
jgi:hypothetical protein